MTDYVNGLRILGWGLTVAVMIHVGLNAEHRPQPQPTVDLTSHVQH